MRRQQWLMLAVAVAFGVAGMLAKQLLGSPEPLRGSVDDVRVARLWEAALDDLEGRPQPLAQWRGEVLVLNFWAPWCPPCREEMPGFIRLQEKYADRGLRFVGVALDQAVPVRAFARRIGVNYPILLGGMTGMMLGQAAGNRHGGLPYTLILDRRGNPVAALTGAVDEARLESLLLPLL